MVVLVAAAMLVKQLEVLTAAMALVEHMVELDKAALLDHSALIPLHMQEAAAALRLPVVTMAAVEVPIQMRLTEPKAWTVSAAVAGQVLAIKQVGLVVLAQCLSASTSKEENNELHSN